MPWSLNKPGIYVLQAGSLSRLSLLFKRNCSPSSIKLTANEKLLNLHRYTGNIFFSNSAQPFFNYRNVKRTFEIIKNLSIRAFLNWLPSSDFLSNFFLIVISEIYQRFSILYTFSSSLFDNGSTYVAVGERTLGFQLLTWKERKLLINKHQRIILYV